MSIMKLSRCKGRRPTNRTRHDKDSDTGLRVGSSLVRTCKITQDNQSFFQSKIK